MFEGLINLEAGKMCWQDANGLVPLNYQPEGESPDESTPTQDIHIFNELSQC